MDIYKVTVPLPGREVEASVQAGVMATIETGRLENGKQLPESKVNILVGQAQHGPAAWVQISKFDANRTMQLTHEGWISALSGDLTAFSGASSARASIAKVDKPSPEVLKCQGKAVFGAFACCTSQGNGGCYVTCCNSCCSDPVGCPGAGCCS